MGRTSHLVDCPSFCISLLLAATAGLSACGGGECHTWDAMEVDASALSEPDAALASFHEGLDRFIDWTGRESTCVGRVDVVPDLVGLNGRYVPSSGVIVIDQAAPSRTTTHEFCHALDHEEGWPSEGAAELLEPFGRDLPPLLYESDEEKLNEVFARFCEDGPQGLALQEQLHQACGFEGPSEAARFVWDIAFPDDDRSAGWADLGEPFSFETTASAIPDTLRQAAGRGASAVVGARGIFVLDHVYIEDEVTGEAVIEPHLLLLDANTHAILDTLALAPHEPALVDGNPSISQHTLLGSTTAPLLFNFAGDDAGTTWRVQSDPLRLEPASWPAMEEGAVPRGFERDGQALVRTVTGGPILLVDLEAGTATAVAADESLYFDPTRAEAVYADERGAIGVYASMAGLALVELDWSGRWTAVHALPIPSGRVRSLLRLADGSIIVTPVVEGTASSTGSSLGVSVRLDPETGTWAAAEGDCDGLAGEGWIVDGETTLRLEATGDDEEGFELRVVTVRF